MSAIKDWSRSCYTFKSESDFDDTEILGPRPEIHMEEWGNEHKEHFFAMLVRNSVPDMETK